MWTSPHDSSACGDPIGKGTSPYRRVGDNAMCPSKHVFQVHGVDATGRVVCRRKLRRNQLAAYFANLPCCLIGLEACGGAHYWVD